MKRRDFLKSMSAAFAALTATKAVAEIEPSSMLPPEPKPVPEWTDFEQRRIVVTKGAQMGFTQAQTDLIRWFAETQDKMILDALKTYPGIK